MRYQLEKTPQGLALTFPDNDFAPFIIDFLAGKPVFRQRTSHKKNELIVKACGHCKTIIDATVGLGNDAFTLAVHGYQVLGLERNPIIYALLDDAITRLNNPACAFEVKQTDAMTYLQALTPVQAPDAIYLDPMHPARKKSALVKKSMRIIRGIVGDDIDANKLLQIALNTAIKRVIVKRPRHANYLDEKKPDLQYLGKSTRFDVYLKPS